MPKSLQIRDVPDDVHATLRARAAVAGMSLSEYALRALTEVAARPTVAEVLRTAGERSGGVPREVIVETVRQLREKRS
jgi:plasmid stability protein